MPQAGRGQTARERFPREPCPRSLQAGQWGVGTGRRFRVRLDAVDVLDTGIRSIVYLRENVRDLLPVARIALWGLLCDRPDAPASLSREGVLSRFEVGVFRWPTTFSLPTRAASVTLAPSGWSEEPRHQEGWP